MMLHDVAMGIHDNPWESTMGKPMESTNGSQVTQRFLGHFALLSSVGNLTVGAAHGFSDEEKLLHFKKTSPFCPSDPKISHDILSVYLRLCEHTEMFEDSHKVQ